MPPAWIVEPIDVLEYCSFCLPAGFPFLTAVSSSAVSVASAFKVPRWQLVDIPLLMPINDGCEVAVRLNLAQFACLDE